MAQPNWVDYYNALTANAQVTTAARALDPSFGIHFGSSPTDEKTYSGKKSGSKSFLDRAWNDNLSVGKRALDILMRGNYASANFRKYQKEHESAKPGFNFFENTINAFKDLGDIPGALGAAVQGFEGKDKTTSSDVNKGEIPGGFIGGATNFLEDVVTDPTTYIGPGAVKGVVRAVKGIKGGTRAATSIAKGIETKAVQDLAETGKTVVPTKSADDFIRNVTRNQENPGDVFDSIVKTPSQAPPLVNTGDRLFTAGPEGVSERFMLPGPSADVIASRASKAKLDALAKGIGQYKYGDLTDIPETGFFKESIEKVPLIDVPQVRPVGTAAKVAAEDTRYAGLKEPVNTNPIRGAVLRKLDEPVFAEYEDVLDKAGNVIGVQPTERAKKLYGMMGEKSTVGSLRKASIDPKSTPKAREIAKSMLKGHLDAVEKYVSSFSKARYAETGYRSADEFMKDMYPEEFAAAKAALSGRKAKKAIESVLPEGPLTAKKVEPLFKEVRKFTAMPPADKFIFGLNLQKQYGISEKDWAYLASASNPKSFATRLTSIREGARSVREEPTRDIADLIDGIRAGRISPEEPGIQEIMDAVGSKSLNGLATKLEQHLNKLTKAEQKMLGIKDTGEIITKESIPGTLKELGPTGLPYREYAGVAQDAINNAQEIVKAKVKPAAKIVEAVKAGDKTDVVRPAATLNVNQTKLFDEALKFVMDADIIQPRTNKELWAYVTNRGIKKTGPSVGKGRANRLNSWNKGKQYTFFKSMISKAATLDPEIKKVLDAAGVHGKDRTFARASAMYDATMPVLRAADDVLKQGGVFPVAGVSNSDNVFSLVDVLDSLSPEFVKRNIYHLRKSGKTYGSYIAPTQLMDVMDFAVTAARAGEFDPNDAELISKLLLERQVTAQGKNVPNGLADQIAKIKDPAVRASILNDVVSDIADAVPELVRRTERNLADRKLYHDNKVAKGTKQAMERLADEVLDPATSPGDLVNLSTNTDVVVKSVSRLNGLDPNDAWAVAQEVNAARPTLGLTAEAAAVGKISEQITKATTRSAKAKAAQGYAKMAEEEIPKIAEELGIPLSDIDEGMHWSYRWMQAIFPHLGNKAVRPYFLDKKNFGQAVTRGYQAGLSEIREKHTKDAVMAAFKELQLDKKSLVPEIAAAQDDVQKLLNVMFSRNADYNVFARNGISFEDINDHFKHFGIHDKFMFDANETMNEAWKFWDTNDPLDLLGRMQAATMAVVSKRMLGEKLTQEFGSAVKKPGFVKLSSHDSELAKYLDLDRYYDKTIASQFKVLDTFIRRSMQPASSAYYRKFLNFMDNTLHSLKAGFTIYRFGHHVRNGVGDGWLSFVAGVTDPRVYTKSAKLMAANRGRYKDFDAIQALMARQPIPINDISKISGDPIAHITVNGKKVTLTGSEVYRGAYDNGVLNDYQTLEDLRMGNESLQLKIRPFKGKVQKVASSFSEARDHYFRLAHFIHALEHGNYKSLEEAIDKAGHEVRKWHPDGSDLSHFESNVMRRTFLFYSWIRKTIPLVLEAIVTRPGRVSMYPKAMYNIAEANGIDLDSMSNPFPQDQLFPDWITDSPAGPILQTADGHYKGISPGIPFMDILGDYAGGNTKRTILGSTNPLIKVPIELTAKPDAAVAQDLRTGINSYDASDYVDRQIPNLSYIASVTGRSPSSLFTQNKGNKEQGQGIKGTPFFNFLTGLGLMDMSKPSYQRQAQKDARNRYNKMVRGDK